MDYWKVTFSASTAEPLRVDPFTGKVEPVRRAFDKWKKTEDVAYECAHRLITFKLRADEGSVYQLPHPLCAECRREMTLTWLWGENMDKEADRPRLFRDEKEA